VLFKRGRGNTRGRRERTAVFSSYTDPTKGSK